MRILREMIACCHRDPPPSGRPTGPLPQCCLPPLILPPRSRPPIGMTVGGKGGSRSCFKHRKQRRSGDHPSGIDGGGRQPLPFGIFSGGFTRQWHIMSYFVPSGNVVFQVPFAESTTLKGCLQRSTRQFSQFILSISGRYFLEAASPAGGRGVAGSHGHRRVPGVSRGGLAPHVPSVSTGLAAGLQTAPFPLRRKAGGLRMSHVTKRVALAQGMGRDVGECHFGLGR